MNLGRFELHQPTSLAEAVELRSRLGDEAVLYAGGTELLLAMKLGLAHWPHLIDVKRLPELQGIEIQEHRVRIGAAVTHTAVERHGELGSLHPELAQLEGRIANVRVRAAGTLAGNICFGEPHADPPTLLAALKASLELAGAAGSREVQLTDFMTGAYQNQLGPDEIVVAVHVPRPSPGVRTAYLNFKVLERPCAGVAIVARLEGNRFQGEPEVFAGSADEVPRRVPAAMLAGADAADADAFGALAASAAAAVEPVADLSGSAEYKRHLVGVLARRAAQSLLAGDSQ